jgi:hypothetical protein
MSLHWPDDDVHLVPRRQTGLRLGDPLNSTRDIFEASGDEGGSRGVLVVATLVLLVLLVVVGVVLAMIGPLLTVFPRLDCGECGIFHP